jgi:hypothetical protein
MNRIVAFGLLGPIIVALLGAFIYVPGVICLSGQTSIGTDTYEVAFVLFLVMGLVPEWLNLIIVALGRTELKWSLGTGLLGGAATAYLPELVGLPHENPLVCAAMGAIASIVCWWTSVRSRQPAARSAQGPDPL